MPITKELDNLKKLKSVGFTNEQAEILADVIEQSHIDGQQSLKDFIHNEITGLELRVNNKIDKLGSLQPEMESRLKLSQSEMEVRLKTSQTDLLIKYSAIIAGFISIALSTVKLLW